ncbi:MAG: Mrp/NBP35 family ATP-binding protein [Candidatus Delongbacteria bacterium]|nr:Mrp/NBP35 family ATP-binding protein [Candidatus Delongbacteria bacterium]
MSECPHANLVQDDDEILKNLDKIRNRILVMSGKGGVGKSTISANLALSLALSGKKTGLLDIDIHGPSIPKILGLEGQKLQTADSKIIPIEIGSLKVLSVGFMLEKEEDALIWRGPMKHSLINQFIKDVEWGELDYLVIDTPPGTGDEHLSIAQTLKKVQGAIIVTTPQDLSLTDVRKCITFCRKMELPILGILENMSGFVCPHCFQITNIFKKGGGQKMADELGIPFMGSLPIDPHIVEASDAGKSFIYFYSKTETAKLFQDMIQPILALSD